MMEEETFEGLDSDFHEAAREHGRAMVELVLAAGTANEAAGRVAAELQRNLAPMAPLVMLTHLFNTVSQAYAKSQDWSPAALEACTRDVEAALQRKVQIARPSGIILPH